MQKSYIIFSLVFFFILLSSCKITDESNQLPFITSTNNINQPNQTWTPEALKNSPTPTFNSLTATQQAQISTFVAQIATSKANSIATYTSAYSTLQSRKVVCKEGYDFHPLSSEDIVNRLDLFQTSTDKWTVIYCLPVGKNNSAGYTQIINQDSSVIWTISYDEFKLPQYFHFLGGYRIDQNNNDLYLRPGITNSSGGTISHHFGTGTPIYKINLYTGELSTVLPEIAGISYFGSLISGDNKYLAYSERKEPVTVYIQDLINNETIKTILLDDNYVRVGGFIWSPDNRYFLFIAGLEGWEQGLAGVSLFRLNLQSLHLQTLLLNDKRNLLPCPNSNTFEYWLDDKTMNLCSIQIEQQLLSKENWSINIETGQLLQINTPTP